jgi:hypothetical protein
VGKSRVCLPLIILLLLAAAVAVPNKVAAVELVDS